VTVTGAAVPPAELAGALPAVAGAPADATSLLPEQPKRVSATRLLASVKKKGLVFIIF
jgi:hypothetical protein